MAPLRRFRRLLPAALALALAAIAAPVPSAAPPERPAIGIVPFRNLSGDPTATPQVTWALERALWRRGFRVYSNGRTEPFLRERRIRARHALSGADARALAERLEVRYLIMGTIEVWTVNGGPEVGLTARIVEPATGNAAWSGSVSLHAIDAPGLIAETRADTLGEAADRAVRELTSTLRVLRDGTVEGERPSRRPWANLFAGHPVVYRSPAFPDGPLRVVTLPLENRTGEPDAPVVIGEQLVTHLLGEPEVVLIDPGETRQALIDNEILPIVGLDTATLGRLGEILGADAVLDGTVLRFENGESRVPRLDLYMRLRDVRTGEVLWSATSHRSGERGTIAWDLGRVSSMERLAEAAVADLLYSCFR